MNICKKEKLLQGKVWRGTHTWPYFRIDSYSLNPSKLFFSFSQCLETGQRRDAPRVSGEEGLGKRTVEMTSVLR